jgi:hypothetical protein
MARVRLTLNGLWDFFPDPENCLTFDRLPAAGHPIDVPGGWEGTFPGLGSAWYRRTVEIPDSWRDQAVFLRFGAVNYYCQVWVNGELAGDHEGGYTPFALRVDPFLRPGEANTVIARVVHPAHAIPKFPDFSYREVASTLQDIFGYALGEIPLGKQSWYGSCSGIWQEVYLEAVYPTFLVQALVAPDIDRRLASARIALNEPPADGGGLTLRFEIMDAGNRVLGVRKGIPLSEVLAGVAAPERPVVARPVEIPVEPLLLWSPREPQLCRLRVLLEERGKPRDELLVRFGMRKVEARSNGIHLNDAPIYLIGALDQDFYPETCYTPPSDEFLIDQLEKARHMGLNLLRCHIKAPDPRYLDLADERGMLIWEELPNWMRLTEQAAARGQETITRMVERDFNHPSLIIWTIINESWGVDLVNSDHDRRWLKQMYQYVKKLDPTRLVIDNSPCNMPKGRNFHLRTDIEDFHIYFSIPDHCHKWASWVKDFATHPSWTFSYHGDAERTGEEPLIVSEFGNWGLPTLKDLLTEYGEEPAWFRTGGDATQPHGVQRRFNRYHLDEIFGSYDQFAIGTQWQQYFALKYQIEEMRKYPSIVGYVVTEFTDLHWEANGLLNIWRRPKVFHDHLIRFQQQDVVLADWQRINYWEGDLCQVHVVVSHFSETELAGCSVEWNISELGVSGTIEQVAVPRCDARRVGCVSFVVPPLEDSVRVRLHLRLRDGDGRIIARNVQYLSFFPHRYFRTPQAGEPIWVHDPFGLWDLESRLEESGYHVVAGPLASEPPPRFAIVSRVDRQVADFIESGGAALYLVHSADDMPPDVPELKNLRIRNRRARVDDRSREKNPWEGDWVTNFNWIRHHPLFDRIPRTLDSPLEGDLMDFQYYRVIPNRVLLGWSQAEDFSDIFCGMVVGWVHSPASMIAQCRWGSGRLLATTLKLESAFCDDPVATILLQNLIAYLTSSRFKPKRDIRARLPRKPVPAVASTPDSETARQLEGSPAPVEIVGGQ